MPLARLLVVGTAIAVFLDFGNVEPRGRAQADHPAEPYAAKVEKASADAATAIKRIRVPAGLQLQLFAAEPLLANPVAFCFDERGRVYVAETFRLHDGVTDIRGHMDWLDDDLACRTVEDRVAMYKKYLGDKFETYAIHHDRVRLIEDRDGDGAADTAHVFAEGFREAADGIGAGVLARGDTLWYSCIPDLWQLRDTNGDGRAEERKSLSHGYGVHVGFLGHDLHGLRFGPDGKLYFSIGDRGLNVVTQEGKRLFSPDTGAVLRCNPDGSKLEIFATGLRNPQELAFDKYGNLFTGDNNSDGGDQARWVYLVEGGDSGWRIGYQFLEGRGPWNSEKMWQPQWDGQAAYFLPPIANIANGPSGLCYYPGAGLPERYREHFFLCDFRGASANSGIYSFAVKPHGATFEVADLHEFVWSVCATDVDFGPGGGLYFSDWVEGWGKPGKGRIYKISEPATEKIAEAAGTQRLLAHGFAKQSVEELLKLLDHADQRVRQEAQFALAAHGADAAPGVTKTALESKHQLARIHALWALGQLAENSQADLNSLINLVGDDDAEIRAQAVRLLGDHRVDAAYESLLKSLRDDVARVRFFAATGLGKLGRREATGAVLEMLRENADADPYLRHAGVMALASLADGDALGDAAKDASAAVRMGALLALRRQQKPEVARFLADSDLKLVAEAARAINDVPIAPAMPELAKLIAQPGLPEPVLRRAINANFRLGNAENAQALARFAAAAGAAEAMRVEALRTLADWAKPSGRDRVVGVWRSLEPRDGKVATAALRPVLGGVFAGSDQVRQAAAQTATKLGIKEVGPELASLVLDAKRPASLRAEALLALAALSDPKLPQIVERGLADHEAAVRAAAQQILAKLDSARAIGVLQKVLDRGATIERQSAFGVLAGMKQDAADALLARSLDKLAAGRMPAEVQLDLLEAVNDRNSEQLNKQRDRYEASQNRESAVARYRETLAGGNAERGRRIFLNKAEVYCLRCHKLDGQGGEVGPDLTKVAADPKKTREYLLESIVEPNRQIAKGFDSVLVSTDDGRILAGVLKGEDERELRLMTPEGKLVVVPKDEIDERTSGQSAMPDKLAGLLSKRELRDLVEFLSSLK